MSEYEALIKEVSRYYERADEIEYTYDYKLVIPLIVLGVAYIVFIFKDILFKYSNIDNLFIQIIVLSMGLYSAGLLFTLSYSWNKHVSRVLLLLRTFRDILYTCIAMLKSKIDALSRDIDNLSLKANKVSYYWLLPQLILVILATSSHPIASFVNYIGFTIVLYMGLHDLYLKFSTMNAIETEILSYIARSVGIDIHLIDQFKRKFLNIKEYKLSTGILFTLLTLGIYALYTLYTINKYLKIHYEIHRDVETKIILKILNIKTS